MKKVLRSLVVFFVAMFVLAGCSSSGNAAKSSSKSNQTGLKKGWTVKASKGFITEIAGKKQNVAKKTYWLYTINGKMAQKGATEQPVKNHDKVVFDLSVTK